MRIDRLNATLDSALGVRVASHRARERGALGVDAYLVALRCVRTVEDQLEPLRRQLGAESSRAYELVTTNTQLSLPVGAAA